MTYPDFLYRYRRISEYTAAEVAGNAVYFAPHAQLNDPMDLRYKVKPYSNEDIRKIFIRQAERDGEDSFADALRNAGDAELDEIRRKIEKATRQYMDTQTDYGLVCFTEDPLNERMWKVYTDNHKGLVIEFDGLHGAANQSLKPTYYWGDCSACQ